MKRNTPPARIKTGNHPSARIGHAEMEMARQFAIENGVSIAWVINAALREMVPQWQRNGLTLGAGR